ncbi:orotidine-5'-phosphate decarboxylase [Desulfohalovibrio reitneri]|uniref:orotidine-5'-phosphate decarboxylase n=1 Tax=Desulfohalovibrio reitneri TaxID=1307759 RepID=UPI0004A6DA9A|nr:orotidine-5'-phosphate decarboxylase [Desulfohalovibrio reitneri]
MAELVVALDLPTAGEALDLADKLRGRVDWLKVGLQLFIAEGPNIVSSLKERGFSVFLDLKLHDIPNTVASAVTSAAARGADMLTLHASGGDRMLAAAVEARDRLTGARPILMGVTVLTSLGSEDMRGVYAADPEPLALDLSRKANTIGLDGVVCSAWEVAAIKRAASPGFACLTPGIRPDASGGGDDQRRTATPEEAVAQGTDYLVVGRPITRAAVPEQAAEEFAKRMGRAPGS